MSDDDNLPAVPARPTVPAVRRRELAVPPAGPPAPVIPAAAPPPPPGPPGGAPPPPPPPSAPFAAGASAGPGWRARISEGVRRMVPPPQAPPRAAPPPPSRAAVPPPQAAPALPASDKSGVGAAVAAVVGDAVEAATDLVSYGVMLAELTAAGLALRKVGARVRDTYAYMEDCARSVDHLADLAAGMRVDSDTVAEHRQAARVTRGALATSRRLADRLDDMAISYDAAAAEHAADYGPVVEQVQAMPVPMADRNFYRNR
ncbi:hypothetical protein [Streptomyces sp. NPDC049879]|uniref:hypothetical protein n=1 Tax=Streptomyces sp. NPDC049879 TaxID=3365598 RepID=UPI0037935865